MVSQNYKICVIFNLVFIMLELFLQIINVVRLMLITNIFKSLMPPYHSDQITWTYCF